MAKSNDNIEQVFKKGFDNLELDVSSKVWDNIDSELFGTQTTTQSTESWAKIFTIGFVPMVLLLSATLLVNPEPEQLIVMADVEESVENEMTEVSESNQLEEIVYDYEEVEGEIEIIEEENEISGEVKELIVNDVENIEKEQDTNVDKKIDKKQIPTLSDAPYMNNDFYKSKSARAYSRYSINKLKKGVLLVRLKTKQSSIDALLKKGMKKKAQKIKNEIDDYNKSVMSAFQNKYKFSDVYFFYSYNTQNVKKMNFSNIFINENLKEDKSITLDPLYTFYMIGDFDNVKVLNDKDEYDGSSSLISRALVLKDRDFDQMSRPFPFFIKAGSKSQIEIQVKKLNEQLTWFYKDNRMK